MIISEKGFPSETSQPGGYNGMKHLKIYMVNCCNPEYSYVQNCPSVNVYGMNNFYYQVILQFAMTMQKILKCPKLSDVKARE